MELGKVAGCALLLLCLLLFILHFQSRKQPHIVFIVADDLGWNDVSWHNHQIITPNLGRLARSGVILNSSYVQQVCSPSRNCFLSGRYPYHTGLQNGIIRHLSPHGMPLSFKTLPQKLKEVGYATHMVGKWHLGFCNWKYTPTFRGFDSFLGFYLGDENYYTHTRDGGYGLRFNNSVYTAPNGTYSTYVFGQRAVDIIRRHNRNTPLFLYLPFQAVHNPLQVPKKYEDMYSHIQHMPRRIFCGMVSAMDEAIGNVTNALEETGLIENTVLIFTTDNGGPVVDGANNFPLRGAKNTLWEGGTKGPAFIYSKTMLNKAGSTSNELVHAVDWFQTVLHLAGGTPDPDIDGVNQWPTLSEGKPSVRSEFVYNINDVTQNAAIRVGKYKLLKGSAGIYNGWYPPPTFASPPVLDSHQYFVPENNTYQLYDIDEDPTEHFDLANKLPDVVAMMKQRLAYFRKSMVPPGDLPLSQKGEPSNFGGVWSPGWC